MKTIVRTFAFAVAIMGLTVACNNNKTTETPEAPVEEIVEEQVVEEAPAEVAEAVEAVEQAPAAQATTPKATSKPKAEVKADEGAVSVSAGETKVEVNNSGKIEVTTKDDGTVTAKPRRR